MDRVEEGITYILSKRRGYILEIIKNILASEIELVIYWSSSHYR
jgi:hypothetical protein